MNSHCHIGKCLPSICYIIGKPAGETKFDYFGVERDLGDHLSLLSCECGLTSQIQFPHLLDRGNTTLMLVKIF